MKKTKSVEHSGRKQLIKRTVIVAETEVDLDSKWGLLCGVENTDAVRVKVVEGRVLYCNELIPDDDQSVRLVNGVIVPLECPVNVKAEGDSAKIIVYDASSSFHVL